MAVVINQAARRASSLQRAQRNIEEATTLIEQFNAFAATATDAQVEEVYGIPAASVTSAKSVLTNVATALNATDVVTFLSQLA